jgi:hypothetical protein
MDDAAGLPTKVKAVTRAKPLRAGLCVLLSETNRGAWARHEPTRIPHILQGLHQNRFTAVQVSQKHAYPLTLYELQQIITGRVTLNSERGRLYVTEVCCLLSSDMSVLDV